MPKPDWRCGAARNLPIAEEGTWDGPAASKRMLDAAGIGGAHPRTEVAKRGFLLYDAANPGLRGSYKLPFADKIDGRLTAHASGIRAAASRLPQTDAPERERQRARQVLDHYEARMEKKGADAGPATLARAVPSTYTLALRTRPSAHTLAMIGSRVFRAPLGMHPGRSSGVIAALARPLGFGASPVPMAMPTDELDDDDAPAASAGYTVVAGVAQIPVEGMLVDRLGCVRPFFGMTGYDGIRFNVAVALADPKVRGIALMVDSPGGEVAGCFDLADWIFAQRGRKPIWAIVNDVAFSAAYALASAADRVTVPISGGTGSIGVIAIFADVSKMLANTGIVINVIQFGARKADGLELLPLSDEARATFQADVDTIGERFVASVARNRNLDAAAVQGTEAATFLGAEGVRRGLADAVMAPDDAFAAFVKSL